MESESEDSPRLDSLKSKKQRRVRESQQRSRARRREYLAELESRVQQCHNTCREADLQRTALVELKAENARLRELLQNAGITPDSPETSGPKPAAQNHDGLATAPFRQLKPRLPIVEKSNVPRTAKQKSIGSAGCSASSSSACCVPQPPTSIESVQLHHDRYSYQPTAPPTAPTIPMPAMANGFLSTAYEPFHHSNTRGASASNNYPFVCHTFLVPPNGPLWPADGNTISCSVAKDMIEQHNPTPEEMKQIVPRLAAAFSPPMFEGESCRLNGQVLFQVLSEMNSMQLAASDAIDATIM